VTPLGARTHRPLDHRAAGRRARPSTRVTTPCSELARGASWRETLGERSSRSPTSSGCADASRWLGWSARSEGAGALARGAAPGVAKVVATGKPAALLQALARAPRSVRRARAGRPCSRSALVDDPPAVIGDGGFIAKFGYHAQLDDLSQRSSTSGKDYLLQARDPRARATGIGSLKVRYNRVFGYYLEVTKSNLHLVPKEWVRKQTTVGGERYVTEELKTYEEKVLTADEKRVASSSSCSRSCAKQVVARALGALRAAAEAVATLDALVVVRARGRRRTGYVRPDHRRVERDRDDRRAGTRSSRRRSKSRLLRPERRAREPQDAQVLIITGPNMAGKSTVMRQVALAVVMGRPGASCPRSGRASGCVIASSRASGASDNLAKGQSTFMVEMTETANILHHATRKSLVVLDEIGRGTSTFDGLSIAWAVAEHLHDRVGARTLFATHYHELTDLGREKARVKNCSIAVREDQGRGDLPAQAGRRAPRAAQLRHRGGSAGGAAARGARARARAARATSRLESSTRPAGHGSPSGLRRPPHRPGPPPALTRLSWVCSAAVTRFRRRPWARWRYSRPSTGSRSTARRRSTRWWPSPRGNSN
jgi:hypothetical protein